MIDGLTNRKIMNQPQMARIHYREVISSGELHLPCLSGEPDQEIIRKLQTTKPELQGKKLEFEIERV
jgi:hypothetical protein